MLAARKLQVCPLKHTLLDISRWGICSFLGARIAFLPITSIPREFISGHPIDFPCTYHEPFGRRPHVTEREARDECQIVPGGWFQNLNVTRGNHVNGFHNVLEAVLDSLESDFIAQSNIAELAKKCIPVTGQSHIAPFPRQSRVRDVTYSPTQARKGVALYNDGAEPQAGHLNFSDHIAFRQDMRFHEPAGLADFFHFQGLIRLRIRVDKACVSQSKNAQGEKKVAGNLEKVGAR